jgi:hypothetical protein
MYSDEEAEKIAGHELKSLNSIFGCLDKVEVEIHLPLMCLIDYLGFRLVAMFLLPISKDTLKVGSDDAGMTKFRPPSKPR